VATSEGGRERTSVAARRSASNARNRSTASEGSAISPPHAPRAMRTAPARSATAPHRHCALTRPETTLARSSPAARGRRRVGRGRVADGACARRTADAQVVQAVRDDPLAAFRSLASHAGGRLEPLAFLAHAAPYLVLAGCRAGERPGNRRPERERGDR